MNRPVLQNRRHLNAVRAFALAEMMFSTVIFLSGGIIGTFHHLYFAGSGAAWTGSSTHSRIASCAASP